MLHKEAYQGQVHSEVNDAVIAERIAVLGERTDWYRDYLARQIHLTPEGLIC